VVFRAPVSSLEVFKDKFSSSYVVSSFISILNPVLFMLRLSSFNFLICFSTDSVLNFVFLRLINLFLFQFIVNQYVLMKCLGSLICYSMHVIVRFKFVLLLSFKVFFISCFVLGFFV